MESIVSTIIRLVSKLFPPLMITLLVEVSMGLLIVRDRRYLHTFIIMNILTNPLLNLLLLLVVWEMKFQYGITLAVLEVVVWGTEAWMLYHEHPITFRKGALLSLVLNGCSYAAGMFFHF